MAYNFIEEDDLVPRFNDAKKYMASVFEPFDEFERLARNKPHPSIDKSMPRVTDGTLAAIIQEQPKRVIQQIPTGKVKAKDRWLEIVGDFILSQEILPNSKQVADLIQKCWAATSKTLTYGAQPALVQFINRGDYFGTDFTLPYVRDVLLEPGKLSDRDSNVIFLRAYYQPNQIDAIIKKETMLVRNSQDRKDAELYESGWDLVALEKLKDEQVQKDADSQTPTEKGKLNGKGFIEIVHCFQRGIGATFYSFSPKTKEVVRRRQNKDPRGVIPIHYMYANIDLSNPLGRGSVEMSGGMQNLLDSEVQSYQYMRALMLKPPLEIRGNIGTASIKYAPGALWKLGSDPNASVKPAQLETASLQQFPNNYGLIKSQILNLNSGGNDNAISASAGDPQSSKTDAGVNANQSRLGIADNYVRRQFESWFEEVMETELNLWFAERSGVQELTVDKLTADKLREINPGLVNEQNQIRIDYDTETPKLEFKADPTSSTMLDTTEQITGLKELIADAAQDPYLPYQMNAVGYKLNLGEAYKEVFELYGIKNIDKIVEKLPEGQEAGNGGGMNPMYDKPRVTINYNDLPPAAQAAALANAGINIDPAMLAQPNVDQQTEQAKISATAQAKAQPVESAEPQEADLSNHPLIKVMETLAIKFSDLPPDSQQEVLRQLGIPSNMPTPSEIATNTLASDAAVKVATMAKPEPAPVIADTPVGAPSGQ